MAKLTPETKQAIADARVEYEDQTRRDRHRQSDLGTGDLPQVLKNNYLYRMADAIFGVSDSEDEDVSSL